MLPTLAFSHVAMATRWQIRIDADLTQEYAAGIAEEAFSRIDQIEKILSRFIPSSDIARANALQAGQSIEIEADTWECLTAAQKIAHATRRAFDPSAGKLIDFWKNQNRASFACNGGFCDEMPEWREAFEDFRFGTLALEPERRIRCITHGALLDLGGIGKGFALDKAAEILQQHGIERALLSAGGSTILALDAPKNTKGWKIGFSDDTPPVRIARRAVGSSGTQFHATHLIDPRSGLPASNKNHARVLAPSATEADALATAFYVMTEREISAFLATRPEISRI